MKAIVYDKKASPDKLSYREVEKPIPGDGEILIRIVAASVNAADYRSMQFRLIPKNRIFGADIAGVVESAGKNVSSFKPGDEVVGELSQCGFGGLAEYVAAPEKAFVLKPEKISFEDAAALPLAGITALQAIRDTGRIEKCRKVLIAGSGGGVGTFAVQIAKHFGAEVSAVCSTRNVDQTSSLGAEHVIDYQKEDFAKSESRYDLIIAVNGNRSLSSYKRILNPGGTYVMVGGALVQIFRSLLFGWLFSFGSKKMRNFAAKSDQKDLQFLVNLAGEGKIKPVIDRRYPLRQAADAVRYLMEGHARAKVVIVNPAIKAPAA